MNKAIWALAFVVLCSGMAFAIDNASVDYGKQSGWESDFAADSINTEGGNVSQTNAESNASTEKWAGAYGNVSGNLILAEDGESDFLYNWTYSAADGGEVCVSRNNNPTWSLITNAVTGAVVDAIYGFIAADADSATTTLTDDSADFSIGGETVTTAGVVTNTGGATVWETGVVNVSASAGDATAFAFCVNITDDGDNYLNNEADYQVMFATSDEEGPGTAHDYYYYVELV